MIYLLDKLTSVLFLVSQKYYLLSTYLQLTCLVYIMGEVTWHGA